MTTKLTKPVARESSARDAGRNVIVIIGPGGLIGFRLKGTRKVYESTIFACYKRAVIADVIANKARKDAERRAKRGLPPLKAKRGR